MRYQPDIATLPEAAVKETTLQRWPLGKPWPISKGLLWKITPPRSVHKHIGIRTGESAMYDPA